MLKRLSLFISTCLLASGACAANGDWSGWHAGLHVGRASGDGQADVSLGGAWASESQALRDDVTGAWSNDQGASGSMQGLQFGYDHQFANGFVLGAEAAWSRLNVDESRQTGQQPTAPFPSLTYDFGNRLELDNQSSVRLRFGYAHGAHLFYALGGATRVDATATASVVSNGNYLKLGRASETLDGSEWGVGYAFAFGNGWALRAEYTQVDLDDFSFDTDYVPGSSFTSPAYTESVRQRVDFDTVTIGIEYRF